MITPPLIGIARIAATMLGVSNRVRQTGQGDPAGIARDISKGTLATMLGLGICYFALTGFVLSLLVMLKKNKQLRELQTVKPPESL